MLSELNCISGIGHAKDGEEAVSVVNLMHPDVILLDINMPGKNGVDVLAGLRHQTDAMIIMLSNYSDPYYRKICEELGAEYFFDKSDEFEKVADVLQSHATVNKS